MEPQGQPADNDSDEQIVALTLPSIFIPGASISWPTGESTPAPVQTATDWQKLAVYSDWSEMHALSAGVTLGRISEIMGRASAAGEQLSLAWIYSQDAARWLEHDHSLARDFAVRSLAEVTGYYCLGAAHGVANITLRTLLLSSEAAEVINNTKLYRRAAGFMPYDSNRSAWPSFNEDLTTALTAAAAAVANKPVAVTELVSTVTGLRSDPRWRALEARRHEDFHRWRPQSIAGGAAPTNPWTTSGQSKRLTIYGRSRHRPLPPETLATEATAGMEALAEAMGHWLETWYDATPALGVTLFTRSEEQSN